MVHLLTESVSAELTSELYLFSTSWITPLDHVGSDANGVVVNEASWGALLLGCRHERSASIENVWSVLFKRLSSEPEEVVLGKVLLAVSTQFDEVLPVSFAVWPHFVLYSHVPNSESEFLREATSAANLILASSSKIGLSRSVRGGTACTAVVFS